MTNPEIDAPKNRKPRSWLTAVAALCVCLVTAAPSLAFEVGELSHSVAEVLQLRRPQPAQERADQDALVSVSGDPPLSSDDDPASRSAYGWFLRGCSLDVESEEEEDAIAAYERALELDGGLAAAHTNLGNIHYRKGDAHAALNCYQKAIALDPDQPEALYNLANIYEEEGDLDMAIAEYRRALKILPDFADAHFNLALTLEEVGGQKQATTHWRRYLELADPSDQSDWRELAERHLRALEKKNPPQEEAR